MHPSCSWQALAHSSVKAAGRSLRQTLKCTSVQPPVSKSSRASRRARRSRFTSSSKFTAGTTSTSLLTRYPPVMAALRSSTSKFEKPDLQQNHGHTCAHTLSLSVAVKGSFGFSLVRRQVLAPVLIRGQIRGCASPRIWSPGCASPILGLRHVGRPP